MLEVASLLQVEEKPGNGHGIGGGHGEVNDEGKVNMDEVLRV